MKDKVDSVSLVQIGDGRFWSVSKPEPEMQTGRYVHESAIYRLQEEVEKLHHDWSDAYHDFVEWKGRAERAQAELEGLRYSNGTNATCAATFKAEADALRKDAERYRLLCELIDAGDQGADDAVGDAYALGAGALDLFLDEQPRAPAIDAAKQGAE